jgi:hypothetical protein
MFIPYIFHGHHTVTWPVQSQNVCWDDGISQNEEDRVMEIQIFNHILHPCILCHPVQWFQFKMLIISYRFKIEIRLLSAGATEFKLAGIPTKLKIEISCYSFTLLPRENRKHQKEVYGTAHGIHMTLSGEVMNRTASRKNIHCFDTECHTREITGRIPSYKSAGKGTMKGIQKTHSNYLYLPAQNNCQNMMSSGPPTNTLLYNIALSHSKLRFFSKILLQ